MTNKIQEALLKLDVGNDNHWTADGLPRLDTVKMLASDQSLTRDSVAAAAPGFSRSTAQGYTPPSAEQQPAQDQGQGGNTGSTEGAAPAAQQTAAQPTQSTEPVDNPDDLSSGQAEQPALEAPSGAATNEIEALEKELAEQEAFVNELREAKAKIDTEFDKARKREDDLRVKLEGLRPVQSDSDAIQGYLASQRKALEQRAARQQLIKESGLNLRELATNLKAPIDAAMARKTSRGTQRPGS